MSLFYLDGTNFGFKMPAFFCFIFFTLPARVKRLELAAKQRDHSRMDAFGGHGCPINNDEPMNMNGCDAD